MPYAISNGYYRYVPDPTYEGPSYCEIFAETIGKVIKVVFRALTEIVTFALALIAIPIAFCCQKWIIKKMIVPGVDNLSYIANPVYFKAEDDVELEGVFHEGTKNPKVVVICCGGNQETAQTDSYSFIKEMGYSVFCYNRRGVRKSGLQGEMQKEATGEYPKSAGDLQKDARAALNHVVTTHKPQQLLGFGYSMGGFEILSIANEAKKQNLTMPVVLDAPFTSISDVPHAIIDKHEDYERKELTPGQKFLKKFHDSAIFPRHSLKFFTSTVLAIIGFRGVNNENLLKNVKDHCCVVTRENDSIIHKNARLSTETAESFPLGHNDSKSSDLKRSVQEFFHKYAPQGDRS